ncbi:MAG: lactate utilization protein [Firmicutes bacterium]|nr:lactate utilization protein [Bacillota bacterium]
MTLTQGLINGFFDQKCPEVVKALQKRGFEALYFQTKEEAAEYILKEAEDAASIGFGGSITLAELNLYNRLKDTGKELLVHAKRGLSLEEVRQIMRKQLVCDLFLTSTNALTFSGCLVNVDAAGNRAASMIFGPKKVIIVVGRNKLVVSIEEARSRIKDYVAPLNSKNLGYDTPCAKTGSCMECSSPARICNITTIIERRPRLTDIRVLLVNQDLGL